MERQPGPTIMANQYDESLLLAYIEEELGQEQRAQVERWMAEDVHLGRVMRAMMADRHLLQDMDDPMPPEWVMEEVDRQIERVMLVEPAPRDAQAVVIRQRVALRRILLGGAVAAMLAVVGGVVVSSLMNVDHDAEVALNDQPGVRDAAPNLPEPQMTSGQSGAGAPPVDRLDAVVREQALPNRQPDPAPAPIGPLVRSPDVPSVAEQAPHQPAPEIAAAAPQSPGDATSPVATPVPSPTAARAPVVPHPPMVLAGVGDDQRQRLLENAPPIGRSETAELLVTARQIQEVPARAAEYELRLVARDAAAVERWFRQQAAAAQADRRGVLDIEISNVRQKKAPNAPVQRTLQLTIPAEQFNDLVQDLLRSPNDLKVRLSRRAVIAAGALPEPSVEAVKPSYAPWPSLEPDYAAVLADQLRELLPSGAATPKLSRVVLPVVIEQVPPPARPGEDSDASQPINPQDK